MAGLGVGRLYSNWGGWLDTISITSLTLLIWLESIIKNNNVVPWGFDQSEAVQYICDLFHYFIGGMKLK